jgi:hypothetical protein
MRSLPNPPPSGILPDPSETAGRTSTRIARCRSGPAAALSMHRAWMHVRAAARTSAPAALIADVLPWLGLPPRGLGCTTYEFIKSYIRNLSFAIPPPAAAGGEAFLLYREVRSPLRGRDCRAGVGGRGAKRIPAGYRISVESPKSGLDPRPTFIRPLQP